MVLAALGRHHEEDAVHGEPDDRAAFFIVSMAFVQLF